MRKRRAGAERVTMPSGAPPAGPPDASPGGGDPVCPLCLRPIPPGVPQSRHHLIPKLKGGTHGQTVLLHHICHKTIHKTLREAEIARNYSTVEALRAHPDLARFLAWVAKRPPGFTGRVR